MWVIFLIGLAVLAFLYRLTESNSWQKGESFVTSEGTSKGFEYWVSKPCSRPLNHAKRIRQYR
jgi:hypothetical protein